MSDDPVRLLHPGSEAEKPVRAVLEAADAFGPSPGGLDRVAQRLAAVFPPGTLATVGTKSSVATASKGAMTKLVVGGLLATAIGGGVWIAGLSVDVGPKSPPWRDSPSIAPASAIPALDAATQELVSPALTQSDPKALAPRPSKPAPSTPPVPGLAGSSSAGAVVAPAESEAKMMAHAHEALVRGAAAEALAIANAHLAAYPAGALAEERERMAIEALVKLSLVGRARARAALFGRAYPRSAYRDRIDALIGAPSSGAQEPGQSP